jgi:hypothetical protein
LLHRRRVAKEHGLRVLGRLLVVSRKLFYKVLLPLR